MIIFLSVGILSCQADDTGKVVLRVADMTARVGDRQVAVDICIEGNTAISGFSFCVNHDDDLTFSRAEIAIDHGYKVTKEIAGYGINLAWTSDTDYVGDGKLATLYFDVASDAALGDHTVGIVFRNKYDSVYRTIGGKETDLPVRTVDGNISVSEFDAAAVMNASVGCVIAAVGESDVIVPIRIRHNTGFSGFSFCVNYDETHVNLTRAEIPLQNGYRVITHPSGYGVALAWTSAAGCTEDTEIARLHFSVSDSAEYGKADIRIVFRPDYDSFYRTIDKEEQDISCAAIDGYVDVRQLLLGDADGDGIITILDATVIQRYLVGFEVKHPETVVSCGDIGGDGVDILDATHIQRHLAGFTVPYPIGEIISSN